MDFNLKLLKVLAKHPQTCLNNLIVSKDKRFSPGTAANFVLQYLALNHPPVHLMYLNVYLTRIAQPRIGIKVDNIFKMKGLLGIFKEIIQMTSKLKSNVKSK